MHPPLEYATLYTEIRSHLLAKTPSTTSEITSEIKSFFRERFAPTYNVLCSHTESNEFLTDVVVTTFDPKAAIRKKTLHIVPSTVRVLLAVESELGGVGASSAYGVMKNVVEDYLKLLVVRSEYRVMIFTSLPYHGEENHVCERVELLRDIYHRAPGLNSGMLLVHLQGGQPISSQVQAVINTQSIRGFEVSVDGAAAKEIHLDVTNRAGACLAT